jgi:hypothetical protein
MYRDRGWERNWVEGDDADQAALVSPTDLVLPVCHHPGWMVKETNKSAEDKEQKLCRLETLKPM